MQLFPNPASSYPRSLGMLSNTLSLVWNMLISVTITHRLASLSLRRKRCEDPQGQPIHIAGAPSGLPNSPHLEGHQKRPQGPYTKTWHLSYCQWRPSEFSGQYCENTKVFVWEGLQGISLKGPNLQHQVQYLRSILIPRAKCRILTGNRRSYHHRFQAVGRSWGAF